MDMAKLAKMQASTDLSSTGGKGTPRRKIKKTHKSSTADDKKLQGALKKLNVQPIQAIEEVNMFKDDGSVLHFSAPKGTFSLSPVGIALDKTGRMIEIANADPQPKIVQAAVPSNTFAIYGEGQEKQLTDLVPGILNQLGSDSIDALRKLAETYNTMGGKKREGKDGDEDEDDIPDLVAGETFEGGVE
ncbi:MAG: Nascent polypeptide-associated complex subunit beta [Vezdaea aestivalis]|nr:MAG: Nascent polypeptide-associated complex subunit beta [Vezdaea aestivalis]